MSAYLTYEISGKTSRGRIVSVQVRAVATPSQEVAEWLLHEKFPSATDIKVTIPAAHHYPEKKVTPIKAAILSTTPVRRTG